MTIPAHWNTIDNAIKCFDGGDKAKAFRIVGNIRMRAMKPEDKKVFQIASEMMSLGSTMYQQMGYKMDVMEAKADALFKQYFKDTK